MRNGGKKSLAKPRGIRYNGSNSHDLAGFWVLGEQEGV